MIFAKPYLYFAIPQNQSYQPQELHNRNSTIQIPNYNYYLYYIAKTKDYEGNYVSDRARLKLLIIKDVDGNYTVDQTRNWPVLPPKLIGTANLEEQPNLIHSGAVSDIAYQDLSDEFSLYQSSFAYNYFNTNYENLFKIQVTMVDKKTNSKVEFNTAVSPRN